ncbi:DUF736 domain-containing protein [Roseibium sp.]|uniref:DUF736 domain-containing protein n=1 Tax=Roseibium sp. TaxID=1936156 RepID=UPI003B50624E
MTDTNLTNYIQFAGDKLTGNIATLSFDVDVSGEAFHSDNDKAPKFQLYAKSPAGRRIQIGGIWERANAKGDPFFTLTINTGHSKFYANLGLYPGQDDDTLQAVIPNDYLNSDRRG